jgi:hypothetical protein
MRAIRIHELGGIDSMRLDEIPRLVPGAGEMLVAVKAAGVGPWDRLVREGRSGLGQALPLTLGSDALLRRSSLPFVHRGELRDLPYLDRSGRSRDRRDHQFPLQRGLR